MDNQQDIELLIQQLSAKLKVSSKLDFATNLIPDIEQIVGTLSSAVNSNETCNWTCDSCPQGVRIEDSLKVVNDISENIFDHKLPINSGIKILDGLNSAINILAEELEFKNKELKEAQSVARMGHWNWNIVTNDLYWSDQIYEIIGVNMKDVPVTYDTFLSFVHPEDRHIVNSAVQDAIENRTHYNVDHRLISGTGELKYVNEKGVVDYSDSGEPLNMLGTAQDITERVLKEQEFEKVYTAVQSSINAVFIATTEGEITYANPSAAKLWGFDSVDEMLKTNTGVFDYWFQEELPKAGAIFKQVIEGGVHEAFILRAKRKDGSSFIADVQSSQIKNQSGELIGIVGSFIDVTTEYLQKQKLEEHEREIEKLSKVAENTGYTVIITDEEANVQWVNKAFEFTTGYNAKEILGRNPAELLHGANTSQDEVQRIFTQISKGNEVSGEILNYNKKGEEFWYDYNIVPIKNSDGKIVNYISTQSDISKRKDLEKELTQNLNDREVLLAEVHHRVKNNLQIIGGLIDLQMNKIIDESNKTVLKDIKGRIRSIATVHEKLYQSKEVSEICMRVYLKGLVADLRETFGQLGKVKLELEIDDIHMSMERAIPFGLIITEILSNSFKYAFDNGGEIKLRFRKNKNNYKLEYSDNGKGFDIVEVTNKNLTIGMKLIKALSDQMDAELSIDSVINQGVKYKLIIPRGE